MPPPRPPHKKKHSPTRWSTRSRARRRKPTIAIVGLGRVGGALALGLRAAGWPITVLPRSDAAVRRAVELKLQLAEHDALKSAQVCILAVPDTAVPAVARTLTADVASDTAFIHCAGALDLSAFGSEPSMMRRPRGSFHPLVAISDPTDRLAGASVALSSSSRGLLSLMERFAADLGLTPIEVPEARRTAYHAGAVLAAGGMVALLSAAVEALREAGIDEDAALKALLPLSRSALRGVEQRGPARALTGPVARGDLTVVQAHLTALPADLANLYRALAIRGLELTRAQLPPETRNALDKLLRGN
ncbi:MAG: Rossmann-like and DUF2520 domain-containing protein [Myxococcaceae bacterium]